MRLTTDRRGAIALSVALAFALAGCDSKPKPSGAGSDTTGTGGAGPAVAGAPTPRQAADAFVKDLGAGKVTADRLTADFAGKVSRKRAADEIADWLAAFKGATFVVAEEAKFGDAIAVRGRMQAPGKAQAFALRLVKEGTTYKADWLHRSDRQGSEIKPQADPNLAAAQDTVRNFLDVLVGGDHRLAHALMAPEWKKSLSPPAPADLRDGYDYGPGFLTAKTRQWVSGVLGYTLTKTDLGPNKTTATFTAEFAGEGQKAQVYSLKAAKDSATGRWQITDFDRQ
jgi:hypothetical protein